MEKKCYDVIITAVIFIVGLIESAILFLVAVIGAGCYWIGANIRK